MLAADSVLPTCVRVPSVHKVVFAASKDEGSTGCDAAAQLLPEVHGTDVLLHHPLSETGTSRTLAHTVLP